MLAVGVGLVLTTGVLPATAQAANLAAATPLPATGLNTSNVGYYAATPAQPDEATMPVHAAKRTIVNVTDFGADPTGVKDSAKAINDAILYAKSLKVPTTIAFPCGSYTVYPENTSKRNLYISNTVGENPAYVSKNIGILIEDMSDVIVDGMGSSLTYHGSQTEMASIRSTDVSFENFSTDWFAPGVLDLTVLKTGVANGQGYRDFKLPAGNSYTINGKTATFLGEKSPVTGLPYWTQAPEDTAGWQNQIRDLATGKTLRQDSGLPLWVNSTSVTDLGNDVMRVTYSGATDPGGAGQVYETRRHTRDTSAVFIWESERTALAGLTLHYMHGFGMVGQLSKDISFDRIMMRTDPGTWRQTVGFADFLHMSGVAGKVQVTNSLFDNPHDDPINIHGTYVQVTKIDRAAKTVVLRYEQSDTTGFPQFYPGNELRFVKRSSMLPAGVDSYTVATVAGPNGTDTTGNLREMTLTLDKELPADLAVETFVAENMTYTPEVYIAGNTFESVPTRGILVTTPKKVLIERNHFDQMGMASIYISADALGWYESSAVSDVTIRNNVFDRPASNYAAVWVEPFNTETVPGQTVHKNITIDANRFSLMPSGQLVNAKSVTGLRFTNNVVNHYNPTTPVDPDAVSSKPLFDFNGSAAIAISGNKYAPGFNLRANTAANMGAGEVTVTDDGTRVNADNIDLAGVQLSTLDPAMGWIREDTSRWNAIDKNTVSIKSGINGLWATQNIAANMLLTKAGAARDTEAVVKLSGATKSQYEEAGLVFYVDDDNYVAFQRKHAGGSPVLAVVTETAGNGNEDTQTAAPSNADIWLKLKRTGTGFTGSWSADGNNFTTVGTINNPVVGNTARVGLLTGGISDDNTAFSYGNLTINGAVQPFFANIVTPGPLAYAAALADPVWKGIDFGAARSPLAWLANADSSVSSISTTFAPKDPGTKVQVIFNDSPSLANPDGSHTLKLMAGPNVVEVNTMGADGVSTQAYRWVVVSSLPAKVPGSNVVCEAVAEPTTEPSESATPTTTAAPTVTPSATPSMVPTTVPSSTAGASAVVSASSSPMVQGTGTATASVVTAPGDGLAGTGAAGTWLAVGGAGVVLAGLVLLALGRPRRA